MELSLRNCQLNKQFLTARVIDLTYTVNCTDAQNTEKFETEFPLYTGRSQLQFSNQWKEKIILNNI